MEGGLNLWRGDPKNWRINNLLGDYKELSAKAFVGAEFAHNVLGRVMSGGSTVSCYQTYRYGRRFVWAHVSLSSYQLSY